MVIQSVSSGSLGERAGLLPGDRIELVNGAPVRDLLDFHFKMADERVALEVARAAERLTITVNPDGRTDLGLRFEEMKIRTCGNECVFCFIDQNPAGMRKTLYVKDEDYRLSFLHGNFVTLSNMKDWEIRRIVEQRLSPIYISVHSTNPVTRQRLIRARKERDILPILEYFKANDITMHTQVVLCPGFNDGEDLRQTIRDLTRFHPQVQSLAVVPLGMTAHREGLEDLAPVTPEIATQTLADLDAFGSEFKRELGIRFVYPADEWFRLLDRPVPPASHYDGFPQIENGIGMTRYFLDKLARTKRLFPEAQRRGWRRLTLVTGELFRPTLDRILAEKLSRTGESIELEIIGVPNDFFGRKVTVAGLLVGRDILNALRGRTLGDAVYLPPATLNEDNLFLDDVTFQHLEEELGVPVRAGFRDRYF